MKKLILLVFLVPILCNAKFYSGTVTMNDNSLKKGFIELPEYPDDAKLKFRTEEKSSTEKLDIELVKGFEVVNDKNQKINFITFYLANLKPFKQNEIAIDKKKSWVRILKEGKISLYCTLTAYTSVMSPSGGSMPGSGSGGTTYYLRKGTENYAVYIDDSIGGGEICGNCFSQLKKTIAKLFENDCPKLAELIDKPTLKKKGLVSIVDLYEQNCGK